jgi:hypothetical protein
MVNRRELPQSCLSNKLSKLTLATFDEDGMQCIIVYMFAVGLYSVESIRVVIKINFLHEGTEVANVLV